MSSQTACPDWERLVADRRGDDPPGWAEATKHLQRCDRCRPVAYRADPMLMFQNLAVPELGDDDVAAIKGNVRAIRSGSRVGSGRTRARWARALAAAVVTLAVIGLHGTPPEDLKLPDQARHLSGLPALTVTIDDDAFEYLPLVEEADPAFGSIIQLESERVSMVLVMAGPGAKGVS